MSNKHYTTRLARNRDQHRWDSFVHSHPDSSPYHLFAWKKAVEDAYEHKGYYLLVEQNKTIVGVLPLIHFHLPFFLNSFHSLPFCDVGNALCSNREVWSLLLEESLALCQEKKIKKMTLRGKMSFSTDHFNTFTPEDHDKVRMTLDLPESSESLMNGFKSKLRSQIRKAQKNGLAFSWANDTDLHDYYSVFSQNMRDLGSPVHSRKWFQCIIKHYAENAKMGLVHYEQETVGGCIVLASGNTMAIPWASTLRKYNKLAPNMLLYWNVLRYAADAGFTTFDFGRSSEGEGTYKFKKQWGARPTPLQWYSATFSPQHAPKETSRKKRLDKQKIAEVWSRLPTPLANVAGPAIRKYISL